MTEKKSLEKKAEAEKTGEPRIDPDVPWYESHNLEAARKLKLKWNGRWYVDKDGCKVLDRYGQPLG